jgi:heat shock protein HslJ
MLYPIYHYTPILEVGTDGRINTYAGCNSFYGTSTIAGNAIKFAISGSTYKGCFDKEQQNLEQIVFGTLSRVNNYSIKNGKLLLKRDSDVLMTYGEY